MRPAGRICPQLRLHNYPDLQRPTRATIVDSTTQMSYRQPFSAFIHLRLIVLALLGTLFLTACDKPFKSNYEGIWAGIMEEAGGAMTMYEYIIDPGEDDHMTVQVIRRYYKLERGSDRVERLIWTATEPKLFPATFQDDGTLKTPFGILTYNIKDFNLRYKDTLFVRKAKNVEAKFKEASKAAAKRKNPGALTYD